MLVSKTLLTAPLFTIVPVTSVPLAATITLPASTSPAAASTFVTSAKLLGMAATVTLLRTFPAVGVIS